MFRNAIWLARKEFRHQRLGFIASFFASIVLGLIASGFLWSDSSNALISIRVEAIFIEHFFLDLIFIVMTPAFATTFMAKPYISYQVAKNDPHGKRLALLRTLPISVSEIAFSRTLFMLINLSVMAVAFFGTIVFANRFTEPAEFMTTSGLIGFILLWLGYMLVLGGINPYIEFGKGGKILHIFPFIIVGIFILLELFVYTEFRVGIVEKSMDLINDFGWTIGVISLVIGVVGCMAWNELLKKRLANRDYL